MVFHSLQMNELSKNLFLSLAENGRYSYINSVVGAFETIMAAHRGEIVCEVTTAKVRKHFFSFTTQNCIPTFHFQPLEAGMQKEVETAIGSFLQSGQKSLINYNVDPSIIGGMVVSIGDKFVDMSMSSKLKKYEEIIKSAA